jgi:methyl-accepting chemotaxis protein
MLKKLFLAGATIVTLLVIAVVAGTALSMREVRVGGPRYEHIALDKELVADILPPPLYIVEAYLDVLQIAEQPSKVQELLPEIRRHHAEFNQRQAYWKTSSLDRSLKEIIEGPIASSANSFFSIVDNEVIPAAVRGDEAAAKAAFARADVYYLQHEAAIAELVKIASAREATFEGQALSLSDLSMVATLLGGLIIVALLAVAAALVLRRVFSPLGEITGAMGALAGGKLDILIPDRDRKDEIGALARALETFRENAVALEKASAQTLVSQERLAAGAATQQMVVTETARGLEALSEGRLTFRIEADFPDEYAKLRTDFNGAMDKLEEAMGVIATNALAMQTGAGEISMAADDLSRRTEQQAATLEETAAALDQITATVRRTADGAQRASVVVTDARRDAEASGEIVQSAVSAMGQIETSASQISQIIGVIDEIAFQTNLLALNAGVEAARAGRRRQGLRRRGLGSSRPRPAFGGSRQGDQDPDRRLDQPGQGRRQSGRPHRRGAVGDRRASVRDQQPDARDQRLRAGAGDRAGPGQHGRAPDGPDHPAERGHGRAVDRREPQPEAGGHRAHSPGGPFQDRRSGPEDGAGGVGPAAGGGSCGQHRAPGALAYRRFRQPLCRAQARCERTVAGG